MALPIIVTGTTGFVGKNLLPFLQEKGYTTMPLDMRKNWEQNLPKECLAIIHLAGKAHDLANTSQPEEYFKVNTDLTIALFKSFLRSDATDFFYVSSVKSAADTVSGVLKENDVPSPQTPYGQSKLKAEEYLLSQTLPEGKRIFILRPCMIHGPGNKGNLNLLYKFVAKGIPYPFAAFENKRSFLSIGNFCFLLTAMLENREVSSGIYNLADDNPLSSNEVVSIISSALNKRPLLLPLPQKLLKSLARVGDVLKLPLNSERLKKLTENYIVSNDKIKMVLNIKHLPVSSVEGLMKTIMSFKIHNFKAHDCRFLN